MEPYAIVAQGKGTSAEINEAKRIACKQAKCNLQCMPGFDLYPYLYSQRDCRTAAVCDSKLEAASLRYECIGKAEAICAWPIGD
jgi:hypothetical protein